MKRNHWLLVLCLSAVLCLSGGCRTTTDYVAPHPRHAEESTHGPATEVFDGLARTERDLKRLFGADGLEDKGRLFLHLGGSGIDSELAGPLYLGMSHMLQDAGYEIVHLEGLEKKIR